jgi:hypothetical protein
MAMRRQAIVATAAGTIVAPACAQPQTAKIAVALSLTGPNASIGRPDLEGARLALEAQAIRMGRFQGGKFTSAPGQLVPVRHADPAEVKSGAVVEIAPGHFVRHQQVVDTGIFLNEISRLDVAPSTFTADFYLWMPFARGSEGAGVDPTEIKFPTLVRGSFDAHHPVAQGDLDDGTTYRLWQVTGDFKNDFDLRHYPADRQTLGAGFFNARAASDSIVYVQDERSLVNPRWSASSSIAYSVLGTALAASGSKATPARPFGDGSRRWPFTTSRNGIRCTRPKGART